MPSSENSYETQITSLENASQTGNMNLFVTHMRPILTLLGAELSLKVANEQLQACFLHLDTSFSDPIWKKKLQLWMTNLVSPEPDVDTEQQSGDEYTLFFMALGYLIEGNKANIEPIRIQAAKRAILFSIYARMQEYRIRTFPNKDEAEVAENPEFKEYLSQLFRKIVEDIRRLKQL